MRLKQNFILIQRFVGDCKKSLDLETKKQQVGKKLGNIDAG